MHTHVVTYIYDNLTVTKSLAFKFNQMPKIKDENIRNEKGPCSKTLCMHVQGGKRSTCHGTPYKKNS